MRNTSSSGRGNAGTSIFVPLIESQEIQNREPERHEVLNRMARDVEQKCECLYFPAGARGFSAESGCNSEHLIMYLDRSTRFIMNVLVCSTRFIEYIEIY